MSSKGQNHYNKKRTTCSLPEALYLLSSGKSFGIKSLVGKNQHPQPQKVRIIYQVGAKGKGPHSESRINIEKNFFPYQVSQKQS